LSQHFYINQIRLRRKNLAELNSELVTPTQGNVEKSSAKEVSGFSPRPKDLSDDPSQVYMNSGAIISSASHITPSLAQRRSRSYQKTKTSPGVKQAASTEIPVVRTSEFTINVVKAE
jgi:hypothetical protein